MEEDNRKFECSACGHKWEVHFGGGRQMVCPECGSFKIRRTNPGPGKGRGGKNRFARGWRRLK